MQPFRTHNVSTLEWRWVTFWGGLFTLITLIPYAWAMLASDGKWQFQGILTSPDLGANHLAQIRQGTQGNWLYELHYTPETHEKAGLFLYYIFLGQVARVFGFSTIVIFHLARVAAAFFMFMSFYNLGASVWQRTRPRRLFFLIISVGSGLGWVLLILDPDRLSPDLKFPSGFPLYAAYVSPHFPLVIGSLALLTGFFLQVYRPGFKEAPRVENGGLTIILLSLLVAICQPTALIPFGTALIAFVLIAAYIHREFPWHEMRWAAMVLLPVLPIVFYLTLVSRANGTMEAFFDQVETPAPSIPLFLMGYGLLLGVALPGIIRAGRRFERDGDQLMFIWLVVNLAVIFIPSPVQGRLLIGFMIPLVFFAVRAIEDYWFDHITPKNRQFFLIVLFVFLLPSNVLALGIPLFGTVVDRELGGEQGIMLEKGYADALDWLETNGVAQEIVLATPSISVWIPATTDLRVVYGHPFETVDADPRRESVENFFSGVNCTALFEDNTRYKIDYVMWGPRESKLHKVSPGCLPKVIEMANLTLNFEDVTLYILREPR